MSGKTLREKFDEYFGRLYFEIEPSLSVPDPITPFLTYTFKFFKIGLKPDQWTSQDKEQLEVFLREMFDASLEEYRAVLVEELDKRSEQVIIHDIEIHFEELSNDIKTRLEKLKESIDLLIEDPFMSVERFEASYLRQMPDSRFAEDKKLFNFVGREKEIDELFSFLEDKNSKILLITGDGGMGKTRLALEFARKLEEKGEWQALFIDHTRTFRMRQYSEKPTLFILDEPSRYTDRQKIFWEVSNSTNPVKLLLLDRTIFRKMLLRDLRHEIPDYQKEIILKAGDINSFLKINFTSLRKEQIKGIIVASEDNFVFALLFAEYIQYRGEMADLKVVLNHAVDRAVSEYCVKWGDDSSGDVIMSVFELISLIQPIDWQEEKEAFQKTLPIEQYNILERIIELVRLGHHGFVVRDEGRFVLRPDPIADYIRMELLKNRTQITEWLGVFLGKRPLAVSRNVKLSLRLKNGSNLVTEVLKDVWNRLNKLETDLPDYFDALIFFTGDLREDESFDLESMDPDHWLRTYQNLPDIIIIQMVRKKLAKSLYNITRIYGLDKNILDMERVLDMLQELYGEDSNDMEVREALAKGLMNAIHVYGLDENVPEMEKKLKKLRGLYRGDSKDRAVWEELVQGLYNVINVYGIVRKFSKMESALDELRGLSDEPCDDPSIRVVLAQSLFNAVYHYETAEDLLNMEKLLNELRNFNKHCNNPVVREWLVKCLNNAVAFYLKRNNSETARSRFNELVVLSQAHPEDETAVKVVNDLVENLIKLRVIKRTDDYTN